MDEKLLNEITKAKVKELRDRGITKFKMRPGYRESLSLNQVIKTKEQADLFMTLLELASKR